MTRPLCAAAVLLVVAAGGRAQQQPAQVQVQIQVIQAQPVPVWGNGAAPAAPPGAKTEFKPAANASPDPKSLAVPDDVLAKARDLVRQLGSPMYKEREAATRELAKMGRAAYGPLKAATEADRTPEVRLRVDLLMPRIEAEETEARVGCFLKDVDGKYEHDLPGWRKFRDAAGGDPTTRTLFAEVLGNKAYHALLIAAELPVADLGTVLHNHHRELQNNANMNRRGGQPTTPELAVLLFLEGLYSDKELPVSYGNSLTAGNYLHAADVPTAMRASTPTGGGKYGPPLRKLVTRWLETRETAAGAHWAMNLAQNWSLPSRTKYAARVLAAPTDNGNPYMKTAALAMVGQANGKEYLPQVAKCFGDAAVVHHANAGNAGQPAIQLQDFALGIALQLTGQKPKDYGLDTAGTGTSYSQTNFFFRDDKDGKGAKADDKRKAAFKKWAAWEAERKDPPKTDDGKKDEPVK